MGTGAEAEAGRWGVMQTSALCWLESTRMVQANASEAATSVTWSHHSLARAMRLQYSGHDRSSAYEDSTLPLSRCERGSVVAHT